MKEEVSGQAGAEMYLNLVQDPVQRAWYHTFVEEQGYLDFSAVDKAEEEAAEAVLASAAKG